MKSLLFAKKGWLLAMLVLGAAAGAHGFSQVGEQSTCPGRLVCPLTGEEVCKDDCPLVDASRPDCPGKIECPLTGELVCRDRCPVAATDSRTNGESKLPPCCRNRDASVASQPD